MRTRPLATAVGACIGVMLLGSLLGSLVGPGADVAWYQELERPAWGAPAVVFLLVNVLYYPLFAFILYRALARREEAGAPPGKAPGGRAPEGDALVISLALGVLLLNILWNPLLIRSRSPGVGVVGNLLLLGVAAGLLELLRRRDRTSALLLLPYGLWIAYELAWSWALWRLNAEVPGILAASGHLRLGGAGVNLLR